MNRLTFIFCLFAGHCKHRYANIPKHSMRDWYMEMWSMQFQTLPFTTLWRFSVVGQTFMKRAKIFTST